VPGCKGAEGKTNPRRPFSAIAYCDNYSTLQQCIDAATGTGIYAGTAVMTPGLERDLSSTVILYSSTTLRCEQGSLIKRASGALLGSSNFSPAMLQNQHATAGMTDSNVLNRKRYSANCIG